RSPCKKRTSLWLGSVDSLPAVRGTAVCCWWYGRGALPLRDLMSWFIKVTGYLCCSSPQGSRRGGSKDLSVGAGSLYALGRLGGMVSGRGALLL
uniref:Uncharacterized protein n=1 Tax=Dromaius novaehollandiae TaxID=8790 RepID=A0A8C4KGY8_DRONO